MPELRVVELRICIGSGGFRRGDQGFVRRVAAVFGFRSGGVLGIGVTGAAGGVEWA